MKLLIAVGIGAAVLLSYGVPSKAAETRVIAPALMTDMFKELGPVFERDSGHRLVTRFSQTAGVKKMIDGGEAFDLAISNTSAIDEWIKNGTIVAASRAAIGSVGLGVGVRAGAPKPDIGSVEAFKVALLKAKSVAHGAESASAAFFKSLLERLEITEQMKTRLMPMGGGGVVKVVASGEAEIGIATVPTIVAAPGVDLAGPLPSALQTYVGFAAGVSASSKEPQAAQALIKFLSSPAAVAVIKSKGMEPGAPR